MRDLTARKRFRRMIADATRFLEARRCWLARTPYDWSDVDKRAELHLLLGYPLRWSSPSGHITIEMRLKPILPLTDDQRALFFERIAKPNLLPRGRGRYQQGALVPRNSAIRGAIEYLMQKYGLHPIGGEKKALNPRICAAVSAALKTFDVHLKARSVEDIWTGRLSLT
jgi:hypothetical protein